jgi:hypothetical protein
MTPTFFSKSNHHEHVKQLPFFISKFQYHAIRNALLIFFSILTIQTSYSQKANIPIDEDTGLITWQAVVNENGTKDQLYPRAIEWINSYYKNSQEVTKVRDPEGGRIVIHHRIRPYDVQADGSKINSNTIVNYVFRIELRENRYRYTFTDFTMRATSKFPLERWLDKTDSTYSPKWDEYLVQVENEILAIIESLNEGMKEKVVKEDEW